jgi:hypothetical protein
VTSLEYDSYFGKPSQETSYHVKNSMEFRTNELDHAPKHDIVCQNEHTEDTHVELGMASNATDNVLLFIPQKMPFLFLKKCLQGAQEGIFLFLSFRKEVGLSILCPSDGYK